MSGKGSAPREGANYAAYGAGWDAIFGGSPKAQRAEGFVTPVILKSREELEEMYPKGHPYHPDTRLPKDLEPTEKVWEGSAFAELQALREQVERLRLEKQDLELQVSSLESELTNARNDVAIALAGAGGGLRRPGQTG